MRRLWFALLLIWLALPTLAQDQATLVADRIEIAADSRLVATGHVEVLWRGTRLRASRISFDRSTGQLVIEGPITLTEGDNLILLADSAELSRDLQQGILRSARLVLNRQLQLAAAEINRVGGRYTELTRTVASSCQVCAANPVPLWEIRAARVVHDQQERQLYFDHAQFRVAGLPVFYIPRLRMPDPSLKRATGFLMPEFRSTSTLGAGIKLPYFIAIGDSRDLTLTPYLTTQGSRTLDLRYRQALRGGLLQFDGALTSDNLITGAPRGYLFGKLNLALQSGYQLRFDLQAVSDSAYLLDYGVGQVDRLRSGLAVTRTSHTSHFSAGLVQFTSIRQGEDNATLPGLIGEMTLHRRFRPAVLGGEGVDTLDGQEDNDTLDGGGGGDIVSGGTGNDSLSGGLGVDTLNGGTGDDEFDFDNLTDGLDTITDFLLAGGDVIGLSDIFAATGSVVTAGNLAQFIQVTPAGGGADSFLAVDANGAAGGLSFTIIAQVNGITTVQLFDIANFIV